MIKENSAGMVVQCDEEYLLLHYPGGHWGFVKGHIESGESEREAAVRECKEETGILDLDFKEFREEVKYIFRRGEELVSKEVIFFLATTKTKKVVLSHEHIDYIWLPIDDAIKKVTFDNQRVILNKVKKFE